MILILGGGITGLTCAAALDGEVVLVEAQDALGGYCRTTKRNGFIWDRAGHFFHFNNEKVKAFFNSKIPDSSFVKVEKKTSIRLGNDHVVDFPFQKNIHQLPKDIYIDCLVDLYKAEKSNEEYSSFKEFVYATVGETISDLFLIPYNQKLYACDLDELDKDAMGRFFPKTSFEEVLLNAKNPNNKSYNGEFSYPKEGAEVFVNVLKSMAEKDTDIRLNTKVVAVDLENKVATLSDGTTLNYDVLINTSPLNTFCNVINSDYDTKVLTANKVAVFNLGFDKKSLTDQHWIYFPGDEIFYRIGCYDNILGSDRASLYIEIGLKSDKTIDKETALRQVLTDLNKAGIIDSTMNLVDYEFIIMDPAYVHINQASEKLKEEVKADLAKKDVYTAGRYGSWTYCSIEDNILEADALSKHISEKYNNVEFIDLFNKGENNE